MVEVAAAGNSDPPPILPELRLQRDGQLDLGCEVQTAAALTKLLHWLGASQQARDQFWQQYEDWLGGGGGGGDTRAFVRAFYRLRGAALSGEREGVVSVMATVWGVHV